MPCHLRRARYTHILGEADIICNSVLVDGGLLAVTTTTVRGRGEGAAIISHCALVLPYSQLSSIQPTQAPWFIFNLVVVAAPSTMCQLKQRLSS